MLTYIEAPAPYTGQQPAIFLAGGITDCPDWQRQAVEYIDVSGSDVDVAVLNPRRAGFPVHDPEAAPAQIRWEFEHLRRADVVLFWFASGPSPQPIALYELGAHAALGRPIAVGCDPGYLRTRDVILQLELARPDVQVYGSLAATCAVAVRLAEQTATSR